MLHSSQPTLCRCKGTLGAATMQFHISEASGHWPWSNPVGWEQWLHCSRTASAACIMGSQTVTCVISGHGMLAEQYGDMANRFGVPGFPRSALPTGIFLATGGGRGRDHQEGTHPIFWPWYTHHSTPARTIHGGVVQAPEPTNSRRRSERKTRLRRFWRGCTEPPRSRCFLRRRRC